ncbi:MAG: hypothetical protein EA401_03880 [Planctomycetota bacterium]|nr:MAG: hypothetical protein EA401_03880 [Planctomycetota bacterium]
MNASDINTAAIAFIHGSITILPESLCGSEGAFLNEFLSLEPVSPNDVSELCVQLIRWQESIADDTCAVGVCARMVELAASDTFHPGLHSVMEAIDQRCSSDLPTIVLAELHFAQAALASQQHGESAFEDPFLCGLCLLVEHDYEYSWRLRQYALYLALRGRLCEIDDCLSRDPADEEELVDLAAVTSADFDALRFIDAVETGRIDDAQAIAYATSEEALDGRLGALMAAYDTVLMTWQKSVLGLVLDEDAGNSDDPLTLSLDMLMRRDRGGLLHLIETWNYEEIDTASTLYGYQSLRLALALRDEELASTLLERRRSAGLKHWLDDVMEARLQLLAGDLAAASLSFCRAIRRAEAYHALGRVDIELRLAIETSPMQVMYLGHRISEKASWNYPLNPFTAVKKGVSRDDAIEAWRDSLSND